MDITFCFLLFGATVFITSIPATVAFGDDTEFDLSEVEDLLKRFLETRIAKVGKRNSWLTDDPLNRATDLPSASATTRQPTFEPEYLTTSTTSTTAAPTIKIPTIPSSWPSWLSRPKSPWGKRRRRRFISSLDDRK